MPLVEVNLSDHGYLQFAADVAAHCFPSDALVVTREADALLLWAIRGAEGGGLLIKVRNAAGDRCVLVSELLPQGSVPGPKAGEWDEDRQTLRIPYEVLQYDSLHSNTPSWRVSKDGVVVSGLVVEEGGRWVVYLEIGTWEQDDPTLPLRITRHRIAEYSTRQRAEVAASWMERSADRNPTVKTLYS